MSRVEFKATELNRTAGSQSAKHYSTGRSPLNPNQPACPRAIISNTISLNFITQLCVKSLKLVMSRLTKIYNHVQI